MKCTKCGVEDRPEFFIPVRFKQKYMSLLKDDRTDSNLKQLIKLKSKQCKNCNKLSPGQEMCKNKWLELKKRMADYGGCVQCGIRDISVLEADHCTQKIHILSNYTFWPTKGGPEAMELEFLKTQCLCCFHHKLKSHNDRVSKKLDNDVKQPIKREYAMQKQDFNNLLKSQRGHCLSCKRKFVLEESVAFEWDHREPDEKCYTISNLVSGLYNPRIAIPLIEKEVAKCDLLCSNCHKIKTDLTIR